MDDRRKRVSLEEVFPEVAVCMIKLTLVLLYTPIIYQDVFRVAVELIFCCTG